MIFDKFKKLFVKDNKKSDAYEYTISDIRSLAKTFFWAEIAFQEGNKLISFSKNGCRLNIYYSTRTVGTALNHPTKGKTQLFRRDVTYKELEKLFINPRCHTDKGYYNKNSVPFKNKS